MQRYRLARRHTRGEQNLSDVLAQTLLDALLAERGGGRGDERWRLDAVAREQLVPNPVVLDADHAALEHEPGVRRDARPAGGVRPDVAAIGPHAPAVIARHFDVAKDLRRAARDGRERHRDRPPRLDARRAEHLGDVLAHALLRQIGPERERGRGVQLVDADTLARVKAPPVARVLDKHVARLEAHAGEGRDLLPGLVFEREAPRRDGRADEDESAEHDRDLEHVLFLSDDARGAPARSADIAETPVRLRARLVFVQPAREPGPFEPLHVMRQLVVEPVEIRVPA